MMGIQPNTIDIGIDTEQKNDIFGCNNIPQPKTWYSAYNYPYIITGNSPIPS